MNNKIKRMTSAIKNDAEYDLDLGTLRTLKMINDESEKIYNENKEMLDGLKLLYKAHLERKNAVGALESNIAFDKYQKAWIQLSIIIEKVISKKIEEIL